MKICKNNFDVVVYPVPTCGCCAFGKGIKACFWINIFEKYSLNCGGAITQSKSDIFKL